MAGFMPSGTREEHLGPNAVRTIARLLMTKEFYSRLEDIEYLGELGRSRV